MCRWWCRLQSSTDPSDHLCVRKFAKIDVPGGCMSLGNVNALMGAHGSLIRRLDGVPFPL